MAGLSLPYEFSTCITETGDGSLVGDGTGYPLAFSKEELFELVYRVYSLKFSVDATFDNDDGPRVLEDSISDIRTDGLYEYEFGSISYTGISSESELSCAIVNSIIRLVSDFGSTISWQIYLGIFQDPYGLLSTQVYFYAGNYYPLIIFDVIGTDEFFYNSVSGFYGNTGQSGVFSLFGRPITLYSGAGNTVTGTMDFVYDGWWSYDPGSGGPIWDSSTGAQLRNPFSVTSWD